MSPRNPTNEEVAAQRQVLCRCGHDTYKHYDQLGLCLACMKADEWCEHFESPTHPDFDPRYPETFMT